MILAMLALLLLAPPGPPAVEVQRPGEPVPWAITWQAPPDCPVRAEVIAAVREYLPALDEPPLEVPRAQLRTDARLERVDGTWQARLELSGSYGSTARSFSASSCEELADAIALVAAVSLDPVVTAMTIERQVEPTTIEPDEPAPPPPVPEIEIEADPPIPAAIGPPARAEPSRSDSPRTRGPGVGLRLHGGGGFGPTTTAYGAVDLGLSLFGPRWRWSLDAGAWLPRTVRLTQAGGRFWAWWIGTRGCFVPTVHPRTDARLDIEFPVCAGLELGQVRAAGLEPAVATRGAAHPWFAASLGPGLSFVVTRRVALLVDVAALLPLARGSFDVGDQVVQAITPAGVRAGIGIELRL